MLQMRRVLWSVSAVLLLAGVTAVAQLPRGGAEERVLSGSDVGFRVEGTDPRTGQPTGTWVVRQNGRWVEARAASGIRPAK